jgi:hypothetical protein
VNTYKWEEHDETTPTTGGTKLRKDKAKRLAQTLDITVPKLPLNTLTLLAVQHYNKKQLEHNKQPSAHTLCPAEFLNRITVNFLRHILTPYDSYTKKYKHKGEHTFQAIRKHTLNAIATQYPHLKHECRKQKLKNNN